MTTQKPAKNPSALTSTVDKPILNQLSPYFDEFFNQIHNACSVLSLSLTDTQIKQLIIYLDQLLLWNTTYNLTAISDPKDALVKHIFDCLAILPHFDSLITAHNKADILDIGTGAGLPAVILAIARPHWQITALDSNQKKIRFIRQIIALLSLPNLNAIASRIETYATGNNQHAIITSRAFASLSDFIHSASPCLALNGTLMAMKGKTPDNELDSISHPYKLITLTVPQLDSERCLVQITP